MGHSFGCSDGSCSLSSVLCPVWYGCLVYWAFTWARLGCFTHREWEPRDPAPAKRSRTLTYLRELRRLRVITKACTPQTSRNIIHLTARGV